MHWLEQQLNNAPPPDTIIHLGAGLCRELEQWRASGAQQVVLVEPNPEVLPELRRRIGVTEAIDILPVAVAARAGREALRLFNFAPLSSLRMPTGLYGILPGLAQTGQTMVETVCVDELLESLSLKAKGEHWLFIDTPGEEASIIEQLERGAKLHMFSRIFLSAGAEPMYPGAESAAALTQRLESQGYFNAGRPDHSDADWPRYHLALNRMALECRQMRQDLQHAEKRGQREAERASRLAAERERLQDQLAMARQAHQTELEAARIELLKLQESSTQHIQQLQSALVEQRSSNEKVCAELQEQKENLAQSEASLQSENELLRKEAESARSDSQQQKSHLGMALRLQTLRENDLRELQQRYAQMIQVNDQQRELLGKLHQRLSVAAEYLALSDDDNTSQLTGIREELLRALTGKQLDVD